MHRVLVAVVAVMAATVSISAQERIVVRFREASPSANAWFAQERNGALRSLSNILGQHTTAPYLLASTLQCYQRALDTRMGFLKPTALNDRPRWQGLRLARTAVITCQGKARTLARKLEGHPDVEAVDVMPEHRLFAVPNDTLYPAQWHLGMIQAAKAMHSPRKP